MLWAVLIILGSVSAGAVLAFAPGKRDGWVGPVRSFALTAALSVVLVHLMPEAFEGAGILAVLGLALGFRARDRRARQKDLALEASYFGLVLHHVGDGLGLGAYTGELLAEPGSGGVVTALAAHVVPVVAIVVLTFDAVRGRRHALARAAGLALASLVGVAIAHSVPGGLFAAASPWVAAVVGGTLLHVVSHDLESDPPTSAGAKSAELLAALLGLLVSFVGVDIHAEPGKFGISHDFRLRFAEYSLEASPWVVGAWLAWGLARLKRGGDDTLRDALDLIIGKSGALLLFAVFLLAWLDVLLLGNHPGRPFADAHVHPLWLGATATLGAALLLRGAWLLGPRGFLAQVARLLGPRGHHGHAHHGHAHHEQADGSNDHDHGGS